MQRIPHNGYLEIWLQRVTSAKGVGVTFESDEAICRIVDGDDIPLWENGWIDSPALLAALSPEEIVVGDPEDLSPVPSIAETSLFIEYAEFS